MAQDERSESSTVPPSVSFFQLFRYSTSLELFIDVIGIIAAVGAGAAQPLQFLLFGNLVETYVIFNFVEAVYFQDSGNATIAQEFNMAAAHLRSVSSLQASYFVYIGVGMFVCTYIYMVVWVYTGEVNAKRIREKYLQAVLRQDITYFDTVGAGEIATRIQKDTHLIQQGMSDKVAVLAHLISSFLTGYIVAYVRCWRLALALSSILPCFLITTIITGMLVSKYMQLSISHVAKSGTLAEEVISTVRTAHAFGIQKTLSRLYNTHVQSALIADTGSVITQGCCFGILMFIIYCAYSLTFQFGTTLITEGHANSGQVINVVLAILIGSFAIAQVEPEMKVISLGRAAAGKLFATIERVPAIDSSNPGGLKPEKVVGKITLEDIKFNYPSRPDVPVVKGIDITFTAGETAALVGASGSGKSTIISLIERFYDPLSGSVKLDGVDIRDLNIKWLRSQIGLVSQEPTLFGTTIKGNVAHGLINTPYELASEEEKMKLIREACIKSNADGFISKLPNGYDTMVGEQGFRLSVGQKQRIAIARAIVSDPRILLLDEATSALDTQSEGVVQDALHKAAAGRTTIMIAHRLSTIKDADCIYVIGDGLVLEKGTHAELLSDEKSAYSRLVRSQNLRDTKKFESNDIATIEESRSEESGTEDDSLSLKELIHSVGSDLTNAGMDDQKRVQNIEEDKSQVFSSLMRIALLYRGGLWKCAVGSVCSFVTGLVYPAIGIVLAEGVADFAEPDPAVRRYEGNRNALWFFIIAIIAGISAGLQSYMFASTAAVLTSKLRLLYFKAILRQDIKYFDKDENTTGSVIGHLSDYPQSVNGLIGVTFGAIIQSIATLIGGAVIGLIYAYKIGLIGIVCMPILISTGYIRLRVVASKDKTTKIAHDASAQLACEAAASIRTVASLTREEDCLNLYSESLEEPLRKSNRTAVWEYLLYAFSQSVTFYITALVFWYGSLLVSRTEFTFGNFFVALLSTTYATTQSGNLFTFHPDVSSALVAGSAIVKLLDTVPEIDADSTAGKMLSGEKIEGQIQFENVHFRYPTRPGVRVLQGLSLKVKAGTYVALVGASGCGKSTVIQLIERFYDPLAGRILLDGNPIHEYNIQEFRKHVALVSQEPTLYGGTVRFNILLGANKPESEVTEEEIEAACRDANILDFILSLPDGFDTEVGGKGFQLSGGQKQRIAIARALLRNPKVLLLDEATSALDSNSEQVVQVALDQAAKGRTTIAIAHRLSTIQDADCIYFIKDGRVSEAGTHDELLSLGGDYYQFVQLQALSKS